MRDTAEQGEALAIAADLVLVVGFVTLRTALLTGSERGVDQGAVPATP